MSSVYLRGSGTMWPLGSVVVPTPGTPVCVMVNVDPSNNNAPETPSSNKTAEYSPSCGGIGIQGYKAAANNNGMVVNTGNVYLCMRPTGNNAGGRADPGCILKVIPSGADLFYPIDPTGESRISPYSFFLDVDNANDSGQCVLYNCMP